MRQTPPPIPPKMTSFKPRRATKGQIRKYGQATGLRRNDLSYCSNRARSRSSLVAQQGSRLDASRFLTVSRSDGLSTFFSKVLRTVYSLGRQCVHILEVVHSKHHPPPQRFPISWASSAFQFLIELGESAPKLLVIHSSTLSYHVRSLLASIEAVLRARSSRKVLKARIVG